MKFYKPIKNFAFLLIPMSFITGCDGDRVYDKFKDIPDGLWNRTEFIKFDVEIDDTTAVYNVFINLRHTGNYKFSNVYFFLSTIYPDKKISRDTVDCLLADEKGKWLGKGLGDLKDNQFMLKRNVYFRQKGIYTFEFEQAMRVDKLEGIESIGIRIEKSK